MTLQDFRLGDMVIYNGEDCTVVDKVRNYEGACDVLVLANEETEFVVPVSSLHI